MKRRDFLKSSLLTAGAAAGAVNFGSPLFAGKPVPQYGDAKEAGLTTYNYDSPNTAVWVRWNNMPVTCYRAEFYQKYPYFYPLQSLKTGLSLLSETGQPWPHHRGLFFGADKVNGGNFWQNNPDKDRIASNKITLGNCTDKSSEFFNDCSWNRFQVGPILSDKRRFLLNVLDETTYTLDCWFELTALTEVTIQKSNHGFFGIRTADDIAVTSGGVLVNSEGQQTEKETLGKPAKWMTSFGKRYGRSDGLVEGIAVLCPAYKRAPFDKMQWFTRNYGNFSPMPFNFFENNQTFVMPKEDVLKLAYRIVVYTGEANPQFLNAQWDDFAQLTDGKIS
ncbi:MAG: PmoA family protein [Planctomycetaceae bacterium]|jgi:hypothetical protein|nr:PmoA family protein [Planctomycetaceae bacterium]